MRGAADAKHRRPFKHGQRPEVPPSGNHIRACSVIDSARGFRPRLSSIDGEFSDVAVAQRRVSRLDLTDPIAEP